MISSSRVWRHGLIRSAAAVITTACLAATALVLSSGTASAADTIGASAAESGRYFGAAVVPSLLGDSSYSAALNREFNSLVAENAMKWDATEPNRNQFSFGGGDHWRGQIHSWDVVNEAFEWDGSRRQSIFQQRLGNGYIEEAFRAARAATANGTPVRLWSCSGGANQRWALR